MQNIQILLQQHEEAQLSMFVQMLVSEYKKMILHEFEYDATVVYGYELLFQFYLSEQEQIDIYQWKEATK